MVQKREASALITSLAVHAMILAALFMVQYAVAQQVEDIDIETSFEERERHILDYQKDMPSETDIAVTATDLSGGQVTGETGGNATSQRMQQQLADAVTLKNPDFRVPSGPESLGLDILGDLLPVGDMNGETGVAVEGYGAAMSRLTKEFKRLMRSNRLLVVWLFDESDSMKNDQKEIRDEFHKVYEELGILRKQRKPAQKGKEILLTAVHSFGKGTTELTKPTPIENKVKAAIDKIAVDESGEENMCGAISEIVDKYSKVANRSGRRLVVIVVTDESGDDGEQFDLMLAKVKKSRAPCYILSRESIFGYPYAHIRWKDPKFGLTHWLRIHRGPETAYPEAIQYDGLHGRWDAQSAGFGPYEQVRLAKESGGIFFLLPSEEENLVTVQEHKQRKYDFDSMREYIPLLMSRQDYTAERDASTFRRTIWEVIVKLNPHLDTELQIRERWYSGDHEEFRQEGEQFFNRALRAMSMLNEAVTTLEDIKGLREKEGSTRWRANYDLALAQVLAYRVRLFQFLLAMDQHVKDFPDFKNPKNNRWSLRRRPVMLEPDEKQIKQTKVDMEELIKQQLAAEEQFRYVVYAHKGTPWAYRAQYELRQGFGMEFYEDFRDPRYDELDFELPKQ